MLAWREVVVGDGERLWGCDWGEGGGFADGFGCKVGGVVGGVGGAILGLGMPFLLGVEGLV